MTSETLRMTVTVRAGRLAGVSFTTVEASDDARVREAHGLLREALGDGAVEDLESFRATVSPATDGAVEPRMVCAVQGGRIQGVVLGARLRNLELGMILYSAVRELFRGLGLYSALRARCVGMLATAGRLDYVISELDADSRLGRKYVRDWGAFVAPCEYEAPAAQGLTPRRLDLLIQPVARRSPPTREELAAIIREVYERVYRLENADRSAQFRRVVQSLRAG